MLSVNAMLSVSHANQTMPIKQCQQRSHYLAKNILYLSTPPRLQLASKLDD
jgi:hypothetical protein